MNKVYRKKYNKLSPGLSLRMGISFKMMLLEYIIYQDKINEQKEYFIKDIKTLKNKQKICS